MSPGDRITVRTSVGNELVIVNTVHDDGELTVRRPYNRLGDFAFTVRADQVVGGDMSCTAS